MKSTEQLKEAIASYPLFNSPIFLRYKHLIVPAVTLIIGLLIASLVTVPQFLKLFDTFKQIDELTTQRNFLVQKTTSLESLDIELYRKNLDTALIALPVEKNIPGVAGELLVALSSSGMTLDGISVSGGSAEPSDKVEEYAMKLDIGGSEENLKTFLERVKLLPRIIKMTSLEISKGKDNLFLASVNFATVYQTLPKSIGTVEAPVPVITAEEEGILADIATKAKSLPQTTAPSGDGAVPVEGKLNPFSP